MRCDQARERIGAWLDGELSSAEARMLGAHAEECPACRRARDELNEVRRLLPLGRDCVPHGLMERVRARLAVENAEPNPAGVAPRGWPRIWRVPAFARKPGHVAAAFRIAAALLVVCLASIAGTWWWMQGVNAQDALARDVLSAHIRSLLQDNSVQVASVATHVVKPWFAGRLEFTPVVKDLSADGFQLEGGRLDYVGGRRVAVIVYRRRLHQVNVFVWPTDPAAPPAASSRLNGYNLVAWTRGGMTFWAASDLNEGELRELQSLL